jgi:N-acyl-D-amino-acid deacylase
MDFDLVVRNGRVIDGSGAPGFRGDVAVVGDRIVAVGDVDGTGREEIDADGLVVAPGFVDGHTHMDAQVFWDDLGKASCWQGITTVVMGNCGYTLAPAHEEGRVPLGRHLERAEDIPAESMDLGIPWNWATYSEYLDAVDALPKGINYAGSIGHSALRIWAMGEEAFERTATEDELQEMERELHGALAAGAVGFSTGRNERHTTADDRPVASRLASWDDEVVRLVKMMGREGRGVFQIGGATRDLHKQIQELALTSGVPAVMPVAKWDDTVDMIDDTIARGGRIWGLTHCRGVGIMQSFETKVAFDTLPEWQEIRRLPLEEQAKRYRDPQVRARLIEAARVGEYRPAAASDPFKPDWDKTFVMYSAYHKNPTVAEEAKRRGVDPVDVMLDAALEHDFKVFFPQLIGFQALEKDELAKLLRHESMAMTFSDAGAHLSQVADCSIQTHLLAYWVREMEAVTLEEAIHQITLQPARIWRLYDRGRIGAGYAADLTIFDPDTVAPRIPEVVFDLPGGLRRLEQKAEGYHATIVNGQVFTRDGAATERRAGRLLRTHEIAIPAGAQ